jgi:hypothetical protein
MLGETDRHWAYPLNTCYSSADEILGLDQVEDPRLAENVHLQELWEQYTGPDGGFEGLSIAKATNHETTLLLCSIAPILFYTLQGHRPEKPDDWPQRHVSLGDVELQQCDLNRNRPTVGPIGGGGPSGNQPTPVDAPSLQVEPTSPVAVGESPQGPTGGDSPSPPSPTDPATSLTEAPATGSDPESPTSPSSGGLGVSLFLSVLSLAFGIAF